MLSGIISTMSDALMHAFPRRTAVCNTAILGSIYVQQQLTFSARTPNQMCTTNVLSCTTCNLSQHCHVSPLPQALILRYNTS